MRILAVDPGSSLIGWAVLEPLEPSPPYNDLVYLDGGVKEPVTHPDSSFNQQANQILWQTTGDFQWVIKSMGITHVAWEIVPAFGQYAQRDKIVAVVNGLKTLTFIHGLSWFEQAPMAVKKAATGNAKADKKEMKAKAIELFPGIDQELKTWDAYDASLIGRTAWAKNQWVNGEEVFKLRKA